MKTKRVTANLPEELLSLACQASGRGITETLIEGLEQVLRKQAMAKAKALRGKLNIRADLGRVHGKPSN